MKNKLITFFVIFISISLNSTYANNSACKIKDSTDENIINYIDNNREVIKLITDEIINGSVSDEERSVKNNLKKNYEQIKWPIIRIYNEAFDFSWYFSYFKYYAVYPISNEVPYEVKRDYNLLEKESEGIKLIIEKVSERWLSNTTIKNACENIWDDFVCNIEENIKVENLLSILLKNNTRILDLYRNVVIWEKQLDYDDLILVSEDFVKIIETNYNPTSNAECSKDWWFFERIKEAIQNIWTLNQEWKDWVQKWKDAVNLLLKKDMSDEEYQKIEKELLRKELSRQWISWDSQQNMLDALDKYNKNNWMSLDNNFLYNTFNNTWQKLEKEFKQFKKEVIWDFFEKQDTPEISIWNTNLAKKNSQITADVEYRVKELNEQLKNFESISEFDTNNVISKIIDIHIEIANSTEVLQNSCKVAVQACEKQDALRWNCWKCN